MYHDGLHTNCPLSLSENAQRSQKIKLERMQAVEARLINGRSSNWHHPAEHHIGDQIHRKELINSATLGSSQALAARAS